MTNRSTNSLYRSDFEHDSCGIGFTANLKGRKSHRTIEDALQMLENMEHRGGCGCDPNTGDGAGVLIQVPHKFLVQECDKIGINLPPFGGYGVGMIFFPQEQETREKCRNLLNDAIDKAGLELLGYRHVPTDNRELGPSAKSVEPRIEQVFIRLKHNVYAPEVLERKIFVLRKFTTHQIHKTIPDTEDDFYLSSLSYKTIVYKGQLTTYQIKNYYPDLRDERMESALALVHSRFSTNTFPKWKLAQPFDYIAHNGEINTIQGNVNWMTSKEALMKSALFTDEELEMMFPICDSNQSDSSNLDSIIEMLVFSGRSLPHAMMMLIPEAWQEDDLMDPKKRAFYEYHSCLMEPWDGPAAICFTDGKMVGATLDRNGLRPLRYCLTEDDKLVMASEAGPLPVDQSKVVQKGRMQPGRMFVADLDQGRIISDEELKEGICSQQPYQQWLDEHKIDIADLPEPRKNGQQNNHPDLLTRQQIFGWSDEDLSYILAPMVEKVKDPVGSMGDDTPIAALSSRSRHISHYFKQLFAQVSNPAIDSIRERLVMSLATKFVFVDNILTEAPEHSKHIFLPQPVLSNHYLNKIKYIEYAGYQTHLINMVFDASRGENEMENAIKEICADAERGIYRGKNLIVLSDRKVDQQNAPIPSLLVTGAVHHYLINKGLRAKANIVLEAGDLRETHHFATVIGYGANAVNPYIAFETIGELQEKGMVETEGSYEELCNRYIDAVGSGLLKVTSKMGISTLQSYHGAQIFEAVGLGQDVIDKCFVATVSRLGGISFSELAREALTRHKMAYPKRGKQPNELDIGGEYAWHQRGEDHLFNPETVHLLQYASRRNDYATYKQYAEAINNQEQRACTLRSLLTFNHKRDPVPLEEVEPKENIFKRFATGAMSFGSISYEAHSTLAVAMNRIGGKSNSGEGGEDESRYEPKPNGDSERSAIKQVASGRFGVTSHYLTNADEIQIKIAQGAKPGEGGQLPGHKVDEWIGRVRHATPGVDLISPPPHHDIYSIEDLAQLIFDLKNANPKARVNVKLVSKTGVGTIAAGVAKGKADVVLISGHDGGTGASPLGSLRHAGLPWEMGLAETHQTLVKNDLRSRIVVQTDGQIKTGRDIAIATLLGAEEWGVSTAALVVEGCIMLRKCHLNTCSVGVATQDPELRKLFTGKPEHIINYFTFMAEEMREIMAELGFRTVDEMVGQSDCLKERENIDHWKYGKLDLSPILQKEEAPEGVGIYKREDQDHGLEQVLDQRLIKDAQPALKNEAKVQGHYDIFSVNRAVGALLSHEISRKYGKEGLPENSIHYHFRGPAGQSFGAFCAPGIRFDLEGEANDYFGKGLSGGSLIAYPDRDAHFTARENMIIGNVAFYGAIDGEAYINGFAGERFCVRNSGIQAVVEGVGDHGCEYMTGGGVIVLGPVGKNFAAGMSGGTAYVYDPDEKLNDLCNKELVNFEPMEHEDKLLLNRMLKNHYEYTGSLVAQHMLIYWKETLDAFVKVMPEAYKKALEQRKEERASLRKVGS